MCQGEAKTSNAPGWRLPGLTTRSRTNFHPGSSWCQDTFKSRSKFGQRSSQSHNEDSMDLLQVCDHFELCLSPMLTLGLLNCLLIHLH